MKHNIITLRNLFVLSALYCLLLVCPSVLPGPVCRGEDRRRFHFKRKGAIFGATFSASTISSLVASNN